MQVPAGYQAGENVIQKNTATLWSPFCAETPDRVE